MSSYTIEHGDCLASLKRMAAQGIKASMCVTSPPYFGLRSYLPDDHPDKAMEIGLEETPEQFIAGLVEVFRAVREVLADDGTLWVNIGDSYATGSKWGGSTGGKATQGLHGNTGVGRGRTYPGIADKNLIGIPWMLAFALRADGWYLRQEIIWHKPNPMPESVTDRCTKAHEQLFLLTKSPRYYFDQEAIKEPVAASTVARTSQDIEQQAGSDRVPGKTNGPMKAVRSKANSFKRDDSKRDQVIPGQTVGTHRPDRAESEYDLDTRNKRSVWTIPTRSYSGAHFATFPPALVEPCILAGCPPGGVVLDPFGGSGTTAGVALAHGRNAILCELNEASAALVPDRVEDVLVLYRKAPDPKTLDPAQLSFL